METSTAVLVISCCSELLATEQPKEKIESVGVKEWLKGNSGLSNLFFKIDINLR